MSEKANENTGRKAAAVTGKTTLPVKNPRSSPGPKTRTGTKKGHFTLMAPKIDGVTEKCKFCKLQFDKTILPEHESACKEKEYERKQLDMTPLKNGKTKIIFVVGGPGSGKADQCTRMVSQYGFAHMNIRFMVNTEIESGSACGGQLKTILESGHPVPLEIVLDLLKENMLKEAAKGCQGFLVDGYLRTISQGLLFEDEITESSCVIFLDVSEETMTKRLSSSAAAQIDIEEEKKRLKLFNQEIAALLDHYKKKGKLAHIQADGSEDDIFKAVSKALNSFLK